MFATAESLLTKKKLNPLCDHTYFSTVKRNPYMELKILTHKSYDD